MADTIAKVVIVGEDKLSNVLDHVGDKAGGVGNLLAGALGVGVAALGGLAVAGAGAVATFADFEKTLSAIGAVSNASTADMKLLHDTALNLGKDTAFSATEAAKGMEELAKAGLSVKDIVGGGAKAALDLAAAGGVSVAEAASLSATAMAQFNLQAADLPKVSDLIAGAANASQISVSDFRQSLSQVGAVAAIAGQSIEETSTAIAVLGKQGLFGSDAGTSLKTFLMNLQPATKSARMAFDELGITGYDTAKMMEILRERGIQPAGESFGVLQKQLMQAFGIWDGKGKKPTQEMIDKFDALGMKMGYLGNKFIDAEGNFKSMTDIAGVLRQAISGLSDSDLDSLIKDGADALPQSDTVRLLKEAFGNDAVRAAAIFAKQGAEGFREMRSEMDKVSAAEVGEKRLDNLLGSIEKMKGSAQTLAITFGEQLAPGIRTAVDAATGFMNTLLESGDVKQFATDLGQGLSAAVTAAVDGVSKLKDVLTTTGGDRAGAFAAMGFSQEEAEMLGAAFDDIQLKVRDFAAAAVQVGQQVGPALLAVKDGALALAVAWNQLDGGTKDLTTTVAGLTVGLTASIATLQPLRDAWASNFGDIRGKTLAAADAVGTFTAAIRDGNWGDAFSGLGTIVAQTGEAIGSVFQTLSDTVASALGDASSAVGDFFDQLGTGASSALDGFVAAIVDTGSQIESAIAGWLAPVTEFADGFGNAVRIIATYYAMELVNGLNEVTAGIVSATAAWLEPVVSWATNLWGSVSGGIAAFVGGITGWGAETGGAISSAAGTWLTSASDWIGQAWSTVSGGIATFVGGIVAWGAEVLGSITSAASQWISAAVDWIATATTQAVSALGTFVGSLVGRLAEAAGELATAGGNMASQLISGFVGGITAGASQAVNAVRSWAESVISAAREKYNIQSPSRVFAEIGGQVVAGFVGGVEDNAPDAVAAVSDLADATVDTANEALQNAPSRRMRDVGGDFVYGLSAGIIAATGDAVDAVNSLVDAAAKAAQQGFLSVAASIGTGAITGATGGFSTELARRIRDANEGIAKAEAQLAQARQDAAEKAAKAAALIGKKGYDEAVKQANEAAAKVESALAAVELAKRKTIETVSDAQIATDKAVAAAAQKAADEAERAAKKQASDAEKARKDAIAKAKKDEEEYTKWAHEQSEERHRLYVQPMRGFNAELAASIAAAQQTAQQNPVLIRLGYSDPDGELAQDALAAARSLAVQAAAAAADEATDQIKGPVRRKVGGAMYDTGEDAAKEFGKGVAHGIGTGTQIEQAAKAAAAKAAKAAAIHFAQAWGGTDTALTQGGLIGAKAAAKTRDEVFGLVTSMAQQVGEAALNIEDLLSRAFTGTLTGKHADKFAQFVDKAMGDMVSKFDEAGKKAGKAFADGVVSNIQQLNSLPPINLDHLLPGKPSTPPGNGAAAYNAVNGSYQNQFAGMTGQDIIAFFQARGLNPSNLIGPYLQGTTDLATFQQQAAQWFSGTVTSGLWSPLTGWRTPISGVDSPFDKDPTLSGGGVNQGGAPSGTGGGAGDAPGAKSGRGGTIEINQNVTISGVIDQAQLLAQMRRELEDAARRLLYGGGDVGVSFGAS